MEYTVDFENRSSNANDGKMVINAPSVDTPIGDLNIWVAIKDPTGAFVRNPDTSGAADFTNTSQPELTVAIPKSTDGFFIGGTYSFLFQWQDTGVGTTITTTTFTYYFDNLTWSPKLEWEAILACPTLKLKDSTNYLEYSIYTRTLTLSYPLIAGITTPADVTSTGALITITPDYGNVTYQGSLSSEIRRLGTQISSGGHDFTAK